MTHKQNENCGKWSPILNSHPFIVYFTHKTREQQRITHNTHSLRYTHTARPYKSSDNQQSDPSQKRHSRQYTPDRQTHNGSVHTQAISETCNDQTYHSKQITNELQVGVTSRKIRPCNMLGAVQTFEVHKTSNTNRFSQITVGVTARNVATSVNHVKIGRGADLTRLRCISPAPTTARRLVVLLRRYPSHVKNTRLTYYGPWERPDDLADDKLHFRQYRTRCKLLMSCLRA